MAEALNCVGLVAAAHYEVEEVLLDYLYKSPSLQCS